jgi:hypothetical protein
MLPSGVEMLLQTGKNLNFMKKKPLALVGIGECALYFVANAGW